MRLLHRRLKDQPFLLLLQRIIESYQTAPQTGLPIGTLTSQYFANFYLEELDHRVLEHLRCPAYARYMDDLVLWHDDEGFLINRLDDLREWLFAARGLTLKGDPRVTRCQEGLTFLGYRLTPRGILLSKSSRRRFSVKLAQLERDFAKGMLSATDLQRRVDALLAFTHMARCEKWRRELLARRQEMGEIESELDDVS